MGNQRRACSDGNSLRGSIVAQLVITTEIARIAALQPDRLCIGDIRQAAQVCNDRLRRLARECARVHDLHSGKAKRLCSGITLERGRRAGNRLKLGNDIARL